MSRWERAVWCTIEIVSPVDLLGWYAKWSWSGVSGMMVLTSLSKYLMATDVSATGRKSFRQVTFAFLGRLPSLSSKNFLRNVADATDQNI